MMKKTFLAMICSGILCYPSAHAQIYKRVLPDGTVVFSDTPSPDAEEVKIRKLDTYATPLPKPKSPPSASQAARNTASAPAGKTKAFAYTRLAITSPKNDEAIRANNGELPIKLSIEPGLNTDLGHTIVIFLDGQQASDPFTGPAITLSNVDRGTHTLSAKILDGKGNVVKESPPVTFHLLRHSILFKRP